MVDIYGIRNCDTMRKARAFLDQRGIAYSFHDYKVEGIASHRLRSWVGKVGWETLLNRAGTTFRKLPEAERLGLTEAKAVQLMLAQPSMIKRPSWRPVRSCSSASMPRDTNSRVHCRRPSRMFGSHH